MGKKKNNEGAVSIEFTVPSFRYKGTEYKSAEVEKAASEGDEDALELIANLVKIGSGVVRSIEEAPKAPKAPKGSKADDDGQKGVGDDE
jgi:hypothetical protein